jgi:hypothetical protein
MEVWTALICLSTETSWGLLRTWRRPFWLHRMLGFSSVAQQLLVSKGVYRISYCLKQACNSLIPQCKLRLQQKVTISNLPGYEGKLSTKYRPWTLTWSRLIQPSLRHFSKTNVYVNLPTIPSKRPSVRIYDGKGLACFSWFFLGPLRHRLKYQVSLNNRQEHTKAS